MKCEVKCDVVLSGGGGSPKPRFRRTEGSITDTEGMRREWCSLCDGLGLTPYEPMSNQGITVVCGRCCGWGYTWEPITTPDLLPARLVSRTGRPL